MMTSIALLNQSELFEMSWLSQFIT
ncbi:protein of unknown function [Paraburkholderia dioscoreae]|uniref:Uncharacterized protein n=1 Tax=Paraburkholderia dioscoreae TaxID=2604047 RepID=A0A5Q4Z287_9BURK|nr:protein of unknown function [Paraburkholderia dioscoreae]